MLVEKFKVEFEKGDPTYSKATIGEGRMLDLNDYTTYKVNKPEIREEAIRELDETERTRP